MRQVLNVRDLSVFRRFLAVLASRHGQVLNKTDIAAPRGVSVPTINGRTDAQAGPSLRATRPAVPY